MTHVRNGKAARQKRRDAAAEHKLARETRSAAKQIKVLVERGHGGCKEAQRLVGENAA